MKEIIFVILDQWADWESAFIASALHSGVIPGSPIKYQVKTLSTTKDPVCSLGGFKTIVDYDINSIPEDYAALVLIGGMSWFDKEAEQLIPIVRKAIDSNKVVGAICNASVFLGRHGLLNNVQHTSNTLGYLENIAKEHYTNKDGYINSQAVSDKNIVTANGSGYLEFAKELLLLLDAESESVIEQYYDFNKLGLCELEKMGKSPF